MTATEHTQAITAPAAALLQANLTALAKLNGDLAEALGDVEAYGADEIEFAATDDAVPSARLNGRWLASRRRPLADIQALVDKANVREKPITVILGFGLGYHVEAICKEMGVRGAVLVFEPDLRLLRTMLERLDCRWMGRCNLIFFTDAEDGSVVSLQLRGQDAFVAQGVQFVEHAPSLPRLGDSAKRFADTFTRYVSAARLSVQTTLVQMHATARNILANLKHYAGGEGIAELRGCCAAKPGIVVSAGPSLARNVVLLKRPGVRDKCVIIAVQTVLKPLLRQGIRPHFVTALDYHEISKRFYEGLTADDVRGVQLVAEAKANPAILDSFPGPIRNCADALSTLVLRGGLDRDMGKVPAGATVAHLAFYLAQHLGCDPIIFIGQDLGFTDGLYYGGRNPIHDVWGPELNPFRTLEMMEWERIRRTRPRKLEDQQGRSIFVDEQMHTYLDQFEREFARAPQRLIDATEGGTRKAHTQILPLAEALEAFLGDNLPEIPLAPLELDSQRLDIAAKQVRQVREEVRELGRLSEETGTLLKKMLAEFDDRAQMEKHFRKLERLRAEVKKLSRAFSVVEILNQAGTFRRLKADRAIAMEKDLSALEKQRRKLERDVPNVEWIRDAARIMADLLKLAEDRVLGVKLAPESYTRPPAALGEGEPPRKRLRTKERVAAVLPVRGDQLAHLASRPRGEQGDERTLLQFTLSRLCRCRHLTSILVLTPDAVATDALIDSAALTLPVEIVQTKGDPQGAKQEAILAARAFAPTCWRGALGGLTIHDELIAAEATLPLLEARGLSAALCVGPDWALLDARLCERLIEQYWVAPERFALVFTQAPPGLCGMVLSRPVLEQLAEAQPLATLGCMLGYLPVKPQGDPIAKDNCLQIPQAVQQSLTSAALSSAQRIRTAAALLEQADVDAECTVAHLEARQRSAPPDLPQHLVIELTTERLTSGPAAVPRRSVDGAPVQRPALDEGTLHRVLQQLPLGTPPAVTFAGVGDPLQHPQCAEFVRQAKARGARVHVQTDLLADVGTLDALIDAGVDVVSVNLSALRAATYQAAMGLPRFREALENLEHLRSRQRDAGGPSLPWIVPRIVRCDETYEDLEAFYDKWLLLTQAAVLEPMPAWSPYASSQRLKPVPVPDAVLRAERRRTLLVRCDGGAVNEAVDLYSDQHVLGNVSEMALSDLWRKALEANGHD